MKATTHLLSAVGILSIALLFFSCVATRSIVGVYPQGPYKIETTKSREQVWSDVIDFFASKGVSIRLSDKTNGLISTGSMSFMHDYTFDTEGKPANASAYIVIGNVKGSLERRLPHVAKGEWNVHIKEGDNKRIVEIALVSLVVEYVAEDPTRHIELEASSSGVFEKQLEQAIHGVITR